MPEETAADEIYAIGIEAYAYLYSLITMDLTRRQMTNRPVGQSGFAGPMDTFVHVQEYPPADFKGVVRPNFDTLYSAVWLDLTQGPRVVNAPDTDGRYYMLPMVDMWSDVFATPGKRTSGTRPGSWAVVGPGWKGELPSGVDRIDAPTPYVWIIGRIQTNGTADDDAVHIVQDGIALRTVDGSDPAPKTFTADPAIDMDTPPLEQVNALSTRDFLTYGAELMRLHPPHATDWSTVARLRRIGIHAGQPFDWEALDAATQQALEPVAKDGLLHLLGRAASLANVVNGWQMNLDSIGVYGNFYVKRAIVAMIGLGANLPDDAVYPLLQHDADGQPLDGGKDYVIHFPNDGLPPVDAFWSVTMYDGQGFQSANELNRFAIGDRDPMHYNADGSLDLYLQHANPGADKEANWLPSPTGPVGVTMRLYAPKDSVLDGTWQPPPVKQV
jgi:hypothetical protein